MSRTAWLLAGVAALPACRCTPASRPPLPPPSATSDVVWNGAPLPVRVVKTEPARSLGYAGLTRVPKDDALLRVWPAATWVALCNRDYQVATEFVMVDERGTVIGRAAHGPDERPPEESRRYAKSPRRVQYVLEMAPGRLGALGIEPGATLTLAPALAAGAEASAPLLPDLPRVELRVRGQAITVEVAHTVVARRVGLMFRDTLPPDRGMLFVYRKSRHHSFWMKNCPVEIDVAYLAEDGRIATIHTMAPGWHATDAELAGYPATEDTAYALEMAGGWFRAHGAAVGDRVALPADLARWRESAEE